MNKSKLIVLILLTVLAFNSCRKTDSNRTALEHAYECESVLGPLPDFKYDDAVEIPMTKNGMTLLHNSDNPDDCDHPFAFNGSCELGNRMGRYAGINPDGSENNDVVFITLFRGSGLGVIGYKYSTGQTCFFEIDELSDPNNVPTPQDSDYNDYWASPKQMTDIFNCVNCHMASPFYILPLWTN